MGMKQSTTWWANKGIKLGHDATFRTAFELLRVTGVTLDSLTELLPEISTFSPKVKSRVCIIGRSMVETSPGKGKQADKEP